MKKNVLTILSAAAILALASCGGGGGGDASKPEDSSAEASTSLPDASSGTDASASDKSAEDASSTAASSDPEIVTYRVHFNLNGGEMPDGSEIEDQIVEEGHWIRRPTLDPVKAHATFMGWYAGNFEWNFYSPVYGDVTLDAQWRVDEQDKIVLRFDPRNGGDIITRETFLGDSVHVDAPSRSGYSFLGWFYMDGSTETSFTGYVSEAVAAADLIYAKWEEGSQIFRTLVKEDGTVKILGPDSTLITVANVPATINGRAVTEIGDSAFGFCAQLVDIFIPSTVTKIADNAFAGAWRMASITVADGNPVYSSEEGVLFADNGKTIQYFPHRAHLSEQSWSDISGYHFEYTLPAKVTKIAPYCFYRHDASYGGVTSIRFNSALEYIGKCAFYSDDAITRLEFPASLKYIGERAFVGKGEDSVNQLTLDFSKATALEEIGEMAFASTYIKNTLELPANLKVLGDYAFCNCNAIDAVVLPEHLEVLGDAAFFGDLQMESISFSHGGQVADHYELSDGVLYERGRTSLSYVPSNWGTSHDTLNVPSTVKSIRPHAVSDLRFANVVLNEGLERIEDKAFHGSYNNAMTRIDLPNSLTYLGDGAFEMCVALSTVTFGTGLTEIGKEAFCGTPIRSVEIPGNIKVIGKEAFAPYDGSAPLEFLTLNEGLEEIGEMAFYSTNYSNPVGKLTALNFPDTLRVIGDDAFGGHTKLTSVRFGKSLERLGVAAFYGSPITSLSVSSENPNFKASDLTLLSKDGTEVFFASVAKNGTLTVPAGVKTIHDYAYYGVNQCDSLSLPAGLETIGDYAFASSVGSKSTFNGDIALPDSLVTLGEGAFYHASYLKNLTFGNGLKVIGKEAFAWAGVSELTFPDSLEEIGEEAFDFSDVKSIHFGNGLKKIGRCAFFLCHGLSGVITLPASLEEFGDGAFSSHGNSTLQRPSITGYALAEGNTHFTVEDGVLYNADKTTLVAVPPCGEESRYIVPSTVTEIAPFAFACAMDVEYLELPSGLLTIGEKAFQAMRVTSLVIPASVTYIGYRAFHNWTTQQRVRFSITEEAAHERYDFSEEEVKRLREVTGEAVGAGDWANSSAKFEFQK